MSTVAATRAAERASTRVNSEQVRIAIASASDRLAIYRMRHEVYAEELRQHPTNTGGSLTDDLDASNVYIVAKLAEQIAGFVSITLPGGRYSIDKYFSRAELPFPCDASLYETRILTVRRSRRGRSIAALLMYAALRWIEAAGGKRVVAIGRVEVLELYRNAGFEPLGQRVVSGAVTFELMSATIDQLSLRTAGRTQLLRRLRKQTKWELEVPFESAEHCYHGGAFFQAVGEEFDNLGRSSDIINADVLDAWFPACPAALEALREFLPWIARTSPPTDCGGLIRSLARARGIPQENLVAGCGSSDLIFRAFGAWLKPSSRVLLLDPTYGEYPHVAKRIGCRIDVVPLEREHGYRLDMSALIEAAQRRYDMIVLVNPNSPTGGFVRCGELGPFLDSVPRGTLVWVDETYIEYTRSGETLETVAATSENLVVCKSMSKVYALSGLRVAYLCAPERLAREIRALTPPWIVSLPGQIAAVKALADPAYYAARYAETHQLRADFAARLRAAGGMDVLESVANFVLCHLATSGPTAAELCRRCRQKGLFLRDASTFSPRLGSHTLRIAVKDRATNQRIVEILGEQMRERKQAGDGGGGFLRRCERNE